MFSTYSIDLQIDALSFCSHVTQAYTLSQCSREDLVQGCVKRRAMCMLAVKVTEPGGGGGGGDRGGTKSGGVKVRSHHEISLNVAKQVSVT